MSKKENYSLGDKIFSTIVVLLMFISIVAIPIGIFCLSIYITSHTIESFAKDWAPKSRIVGGKQKSGPEMYYNRWGGYSKVYLLRAKGRTASKAEKAYAYAKKQVTSNKPYSYQFLNKKRTSHFYCSSLVWRACYEQSINIDHVKYDSIVTPLELVKSNNTVIIS